MVGGFITFVVKSYYIDGCYYIYGRYSCDWWASIYFVLFVGLFVCFLILFSRSDDSWQRWTQSALSWVLIISIELNNVFNMFTHSV